LFDWARKDRDFPHLPANVTLIPGATPNQATWRDDHQMAPPLQIEDVTGLRNQFDATMRLSLPSIPAASAEFAVLY
jgi:hypothetical protein